MPFDDLILQNLVEIFLLFDIFLQHFLQLFPLINKHWDYFPINQDGASD